MARRGSQQAHAKAGLSRHYQEEEEQGARHKHYEGRTLTPGALGLLALVLLVSGMLFSSCSPASSGALFLAEGQKKEAPTITSSHQAAGASAAEEREEVLDAYRKLPLSFVANEGQIEEEAVRYYAKGAGYGFFFSPKEAVLSFFSKGEHRGTALALSFLGANPRATLEARQRLPGKVNYLVGDDPSGWHTGLATHGELLYRGLWPGIDMVVSGEGGKLNYEFLVEPGASVKEIRLAYQGAKELSVGDDGELLIDTPLGLLEDAAPRSYQTIEGKRVAIDSRYALEKGSKQGYSFRVGAGYDSRYPLVIDPGLAYSTFIGGTGSDGGSGIAVDRRGQAYLTGVTSSTDYPTTPGAFDTSFNGDSDAFVSKLNTSSAGR